MVRVRVAAALLLNGAVLIVVFNVVSDRGKYYQAPKILSQPQASKTLTHVTSEEVANLSGILDQIPGGTMWRYSNECMHGGGRYQNIEKKRNAEVLRETAPLRWLQLEERLRSLDAYLDAHRGSNQEWKFPPTNAMKHTRHDGIFMASYKDKIKGKRIWETLLESQNRSNQMNSFCEIGISLGHSTLLWLEANPVGCVYMFDLPDETAYEPLMKYAIQYLKLVYTERIVIVQGDHKDTIPAFAERSKVKCDSISLDGPKGEEGREMDFRLFQSLAHEDTLLFIDDIAPEAVVNFSIPSKNLGNDAEKVARRWLETGKIEALKVLALPLAQGKSWISDGVSTDSRIYPSAGCGHGTLVARYTTKL